MPEKYGLPLVTSDSFEDYMVDLPLPVIRREIYLFNLQKAGQTNSLGGILGGPWRMF